MMPPEDAGQGLPPEPGMEGIDPTQEPETEFQPAPLLPPSPINAVDYTVQLDEEALQDLGRRVVDEWMAWDMATQERRADAKEWRADANLRPSNQPLPWKNAAQVRFPHLATACSAHTGRLNGHIGSGNPPWAAIPEDEAAQEHAPKLERAVKAALESARFERFKREAHRELPIVTPCAVRTQWERVARRYPEIALEQDEEAAGALIEAGVDPREAMTATVKRGPDGLAKLGLRMQERVIREGPTFTIVPFERLVLCPVSATSREDLWGIGERLTLRGLDLQQGAEPREDEQGQTLAYPRYLKAQVAEILAYTGDQPDQETQERGEDRGVDVMTPGPSREAIYRQYDCVELDWYDDLNKDGEMEWYVVGVHLTSRKVFRCQYCADQHGMGRYEIFGYLEETGNIFGMSLAERMQYLQDGATALVNQFINLMDKLVGSAGNFLYDRRAKRLRPDQWYIDPAQPIQVDDVNGIMLNPIAQGLSQALQPLLEAISMFKGWYDLLTAANNIMLGSPTDAKKTLGEVRDVQQQTNAIFEDWSAGVAESWERVIERVASLLGQYSEGGQFKFREKGPDGKPTFSTTPSAAFEAKVTWGCTGLSQLPDMQSRAQRDMLVLSVLTQHPLTMQDWPTQVKILKEFLQDVQFPGWEQIATGLEKAAASLMLDQMTQNAMGASAAEGEAGQNELVMQQGQQGLQQGQQQLEKGSAEEKRAQANEQRQQDAHGLSQIQGLQQVAAGPPNGEKKPTKK